MKIKGFSIIYEFFIFLLILLYLTITIAGYTGSEILEAKQIKWIDYSLIFYFFIEYIIRLTIASDKGKFVKENIFDLIAIIPLDAFFKVARLMRLVRLFRIMKVSKTLQGIFKSGGLNYVFAFTLIVLTWGATSNFILEKGHNQNINSFLDSIWWAVVTVSTVGYGDISPVTMGGRIIAGILMLVGIGLIGSITGSMAMYFSNLERTVERDNKAIEENEDDFVPYITRRLAKIDMLDEEEIEHLIDSIRIRHKKKGTIRDDEMTKANDTVGGSTNGMSKM
ncbi:ion transporter [Psychrobacillus sp. NEAU-3TGS]|uniref:ion transporter n=1 Tax=Psychrobacillus sp. NEAU-3TGS TaxID=2995412 RepID=UPI0024966BA7|nr:ion transporter [Psychrobacillus sp. NEAU-3TGS]MDI2588888.1 ion transporter [Psychrobacillus sp. NEAU-3TGS]